MSNSKTSFDLPASEEAVRRSVKRARESVDQFAQRWQAFTQEWDARPFVCELCQQRERRSVTLFCDTGKYISNQYNDTFWVCDVCLGDRDAPGFNRSLVFKRFDLTQPHAWAGSLQNDYRNGILSCAPIADASFVVPVGLKHAIDPDALTPVQEWFGPHGPWAAFVGINIATAPSLRAWLPLQGSLTVKGGMWDSETITLIPVVCCDTDSPAWGNVVVVEFFHRGSMSRWTRLSESINALAEEGKGDVIKRFWVARIAGADTAGIETPKPVSFNQTNLASMITGVDMYAAITGGGGGAHSDDDEDDQDDGDQGDGGSDLGDD